MSYERLAYDDQDSAHEMHEDCTACGRRIDLVRRPLDAAALTTPAPALTYDRYPREVPKPEIRVSDAAAHLGARLHLHLE